MRLITALFFLTLTTFFGALGCQSTSNAPRKIKVKSYDLVFTVDASLSGASIQVDVLGANGLSDLPQWEAYPVTDYWKPKDAMRRDSPKRVLSFGPGQDVVQKISVLDGQWADWLKGGVQYIVIIADLPGGGFVDRAGNADPRRLIIPLDVKEWSKDQTSIKVLIQESGLKLQTPRIAQ